jgi:hypothetical protein
MSTSSRWICQPWLKCARLEALDAEYAAHLFEPFTTKAEGIGIGLLVGRSIASRRMGAAVCGCGRTAAARRRVSLSLAVEMLGERETTADVVLRRERARDGV